MWGDDDQMLLSQKISGPRAGFTLVETMIAMGIMGIIGVAIMVFVSQSTDQTLHTEALNARMAIAQTLGRTIASYSDILSSSQRNSELAYCLGATKGTCSVTNPQNPMYFDLYRSNGMKIAGTQGSPVNYGRTGQVNCAAVPGSSTCPFWQARAMFFATCPGGKLTCDQASTVTVRYELVPVKKEYQGRPLKGQSLSAAHRVFKQALKSGQNCPEGTEQRGLDQDGKILCVCRFGFKQIGVNAEGFPTCESGMLSCKPGQILKGRFADGRPDCANVRTVCGNVTFGAEDAKCPNAGWLESINLGYCKPGAGGGKKGGSKVIKCDTNQGYCCWYEEQ